MGLPRLFCQFTILVLHPDVTPYNIMYVSNKGNPTTEDGKKMQQLLVTNTRTGNERHASTDKIKTFCGRKVTATWGPEGTPIETQTELPDGSWSETFSDPAKVTCEKCQAAMPQDECDACGGIDPDCATCEARN